jgi:tRNA threonylcarbamoyladenosine biosynthesis protein TsaB
LERAHGLSLKQFECDYQRACDNQSLMKFLAFDTSTELLHLGASDGSRQLCHVRAGAAESSATLLPLALSTLSEMGMSVQGLTALVMGRGPGSFTGLRTACAVAQGLAMGAGLPVLPIDTLLALAEDARQGRPRLRVLAVLDARMNQYYVAAYEYQGDGWLDVAAPALLDPADVRFPPAWTDGSSPVLLAGIGTQALCTPLRTPTAPAFEAVSAAPTADALLRLAPAAWRNGGAVAAEQAMPLYLRDKVAQTTAEREAAKSP